MSKRARIAQLREDLDPPTLSESAGSSFHFVDEADDGRPTLDPGFSVDELLDERPTLDGNEEAGAVDIEVLVTPQPTSTPGSERRRKIAAQRGAQMESHERKREGVWDAVEDRYRTEGHWTDLVEMYIQRVEGTGDLDVKGSLFLRIGQVLRDELDDPQQALDAFVEALLLEPHNAEAIEAVEATARDRGWWSELLATMKRELGNVKSPQNAVAICEHAMRWAERELKTPARAEPFLEHIRQVDPGHPAVH